MESLTGKGRVLERQVVTGTGRKGFQRWRPWKENMLCFASRANVPAWTALGGEDALQYREG